MLYEMRLPHGVTGSMVIKIMEKYDVELVQTDQGPVLQGELEELEKARDEIIKYLNERIKELEGR
ncbi:hypothetical protein [Methanothermobacter tenebrarum]|uniref:Uncharacterized protein n=1 Tax=Methanothermobacter tenebrarum TaxID=680118 RepID=A0A328PES8_9EURY|nr:hypothetical protein [Methanothermobacter tenebrarum]MBC7101061.1 hypothetical protein [Methanobacteriales archaeon]MBC7118452.1 hypothetical protein [Methanobacteriaceae archaeon]NPV64163.1 hypothetical protein [Methanobacteriaceae archaeon]RAO79781.1 hypothetical protein DPC56_00390 [Methanothermobacter tenebrarum]